MATTFENVVPADVLDEVAALRSEVAALEPKLAELSTRAAAAARKRDDAVAAADMFADNETQSWYFNSVDEASGLSSLWDECQRAANALCEWMGVKVAL